jgi:hypothetical protein
MVQECACHHATWFALNLPSGTKFSKMCVHTVYTQCLPEVSPRLVVFYVYTKFSTIVARNHAGFDYFRASGYCTIVLEQIIYQ